MVELVYGGCDCLDCYGYLKFGSLETFCFGVVSLCFVSFGGLARFRLGVCLVCLGFALCCLREFSVLSACATWVCVS